MFEDTCLRVRHTVQGRGSVSSQTKHQYLLKLLVQWRNEMMYHPSLVSSTDRYVNWSGGSVLGALSRGDVWNNNEQELSARVVTHEASQDKISYEARRLTYSGA